MPWGAVAGAVVGAVANKAMQPKDKNGGAGTTTATKEPWEAAQPWIKENLAQGQALQQQYMAQPFSPQQQAAYNNSYAQSDYMRELVPGLLNQIQGQQVGFDRNNPQARQKAWDWGLMGDNMSDAAKGLLGSQSMVGAAKQDQAAKDAAAAAAAEAAAKKKLYGGEFINQGDILSGLNFTGHGAGGHTLLGTGRLGEFRYGDVYQPGTQGYRDMNEYFLMGGADPNNMYGRANPNDPNSVLWNPHQNAGGA